MMRYRTLFRTTAHPAEGISKLETIYPITKDSGRPTTHIHKQLSFSSPHPYQRHRICIRVNISGSGSQVSIFE
jgi:hypothetical protein